MGRRVRAQHLCRRQPHHVDHFGGVLVSRFLVDTAIRTITGLCFAAMIITIWMVTL